MMSSAKGAVISAAIPMEAITPTSTMTSSVMRGVSAISHMVAVIITTA
jgi:hypothetical protein